MIPLNGTGFSVPFVYNGSGCMKNVRFAIVNSGATVDVPLGDDSYSIHIGTGLLDHMGELFQARAGQRGVLITSDSLHPIYGDRVERALADGGWELQVLQVPDGESAKNLSLA